MNSNKEYAKALFMLACEHNITEEIETDLLKIKEIISLIPQYPDFLASPAIPLSERLAAIDEAFGQMQPFVKNFLKIVCENGRAKELLTYIDEFSVLKDAIENSISVSVSSAVALSDGQKAKLEEKLEQMYHKKPLPVYTVDKALLGGIKIEVDGTILDGTLENKLSQYKGVMNG